MTLPLPSHASNLIGHEPALTLFEKAFQKGTLSHAWLISGPSGIGKETFVFHCIKLLLKISPNSLDEKRLLAGTHEGIVILRREIDDHGLPKKRDIPVEEVRHLNHFFQRTSTHNTWRVAVIDGAENLSISAANALLKLIEEPPPRTVFFLITSRLGSIQDTIRSRCRLLKLFPLSDRDMRKLIPEISESVLKYAKGSPRIALLLSEEKYAHLPNLIDALIEGGALDTIKEKISHLQQGEGTSLFYLLLKEGIACKSRQAVQNENYIQAQELAKRYFKLQELLLDSERFSLEKDQVLTESLALLQ
ncbi:hypothetical protein FAI41_00335 [Acetobacteraceae bacterium]|nr:hypothetical protein FAI41_00335 [Acetobacteraceae bacterium]